MGLRQPYYFRTIAELEHYTRAAEKLYVSQSNLSHAIRELEGGLNVKLFLQKGCSIKLAKYGELLLPYVQKTVETLENGISTLKDYINPNSGTVTIASFPSLTQFVPDIIARYASKTNRMNVHFQLGQESFYNLQEKLLTGRADLLLSTKIKNPQVECFHLGTHQLVLLIPQGRQSARQKGMGLEEPDHENFINFDEMSQLHHQNKEIFQELGIGPDIMMGTPQDMIVYGLVAAQRRVAIIPCPLGGAPYNTKILPISDEIFQRDIYLIWNENRYIPPAAEYFRDFLIRSGKMFDQFLARNGPSVI